MKYYIITCVADYLVKAKSFDDAKAKLNKIIKGLFLVTDFREVSQQEAETKRKITIYNDDVALLSSFL